MEVELMVTKRDDQPTDRQPGEYRAICLGKVGRQSFAMICTIFDVLLHLCCFDAKSLFYAIYAVLSRNLFCRYLRALAWRKIEPKFLSVEKKGQISGMVPPHTNKLEQLLVLHKCQTKQGTRWPWRSTRQGWA